MKLLSRPGAGILCLSDLGPRFGTRDFFDLFVLSTHGVSGELELGNGFTCPGNVDRKTFFCGKSPFQISELEVFKVNF